MQLLQKKEKKKINSILPFYYNFVITLLQFWHTFFKHPPASPFTLHQHARFLFHVYYTPKDNSSFFLQNSNSKQNSRFFKSSYNDLRESSKIDIFHKRTWNCENKKSYAKEKLVFQTSFSRKKKNMPFHVSRIILSPITKNLNSKPTLDFSPTIFKIDTTSWQSDRCPVAKEKQREACFPQTVPEDQKRKGEKRPIAVFISPSSFFDDRNRFSLQFSIIQRPFRNASSSPSLLNLYESLSSTLARHGRGRQSRSFHVPRARQRDVFHGWAKVLGPGYKTTSADAWPSSIHNCEPFSPSDAGEKLLRPCAGSVANWSTAMKLTFSNLV